MLPFVSMFLSSTRFVSRCPTIPEPPPPLGFRPRWKVTIYVFMITIVCIITIVINKIASGFPCMFMLNRWQILDYLCMRVGLKDLCTFLQKLKYYVSKTIIFKIYFIKIRYLIVATRLLESTHHLHHICSIPTKACHGFGYVFFYVFRLLS